MSDADFIKAVVVLIIAVIFVIGGVVFLAIKQAKRKKDAPPPIMRPTQMSVTPSLIQQAPRPVAPKEKPAYSYDDVDIYVLDAFDRSKLHVGDLLELIPEPDNEYDPKAVAVIHNGYQVGYMHRNKLQRMYHDFVKRDGFVIASVAQVTPEILLKLSYYYKNGN